jgi:hypothetical protein
MAEIADLLAAGNGAGQDVETADAGSAA